jgi:drug/metabolite transporter (DMT)-like permease
MDSRRELLGIALILGVGICFALSNTLAGLSYTGGSDALTVSTFRYFLPALILVVALRMTGTAILLPRRDGLVACALGFVTVVYSWSLLAAIEVMPVSLAVLIFFLFPLITSFLMIAFGWDWLRLSTIAAALVAFVGLALALGADFRALAPWGIVQAAISAIGLAVVSVVSSRVIRAGDARRVTLYIVTTAAFTFLAVTLLRGEFALPNTNAAWWGFVINNFTFAAAVIGYFAGIRLIGPVKTTFYSYVEPLATMAAAFLLLGQRLEPTQIAGVLVVILALVAAGLVNLRGAASTSRAESA